MATLTQADSAAAQEALVAALSHPLADVRRHVLFELSVKKCDHSVIGEFVTLFHDTNAFVRIAAIDALAKNVTEAEIPALLATLNETGYAEKPQIIEALGRLKARSAVEPLVHLYESAKLNVRVAIITTLGIIGDDTALLFLKHVLHSYDTQLAQKAATALLHIGTDNALDSVIDHLGAISKHDGKSILDSIPPSTINPFIVRLDQAYQTMLPSKDEEDSELAARLRRKIVSMLGELKHKNAIPTLVKAMDDNDRIVRQETIIALKSIADERALPAFMTILRYRFKDYDEKTLLYAIQGIGQIGNARVIPQLKAVLREMLDDYTELALQIINVLGELGDYETVTYFRNLKSEIQNRKLYHSDKRRELIHAIDQSIEMIRVNL